MFHHFVSSTRMKSFRFSPVLLSLSMCLVYGHTAVLVEDKRLDVQGKMDSGLTFPILDQGILRKLKRSYPVHSGGFRLTDKNNGIKLLLRKIIYRKQGQTSWIIPGQFYEKLTLRYM